MLKYFFHGGNSDWLPFKKNTTGAAGTHGISQGNNVAIGRSNKSRNQSPGRALNNHYRFFYSINGLLQGGIFLNIHTLFLINYNFALLKILDKLVIFKIGTGKHVRKNQGIKQ